MRVLGELLISRTLQPLLPLLRRSPTIAGNAKQRPLLLVLPHSLGKMLKPYGFRVLAAESAALRHQLLILQRSRKRAPKLSPTDRFILGWYILLVKPPGISKIALIIKPSTLLSYHKALIKRKYSALYPAKPSPTGQTQEIISAVVEMKRRNPRYGTPQIANHESQLKYMRMAEPLPSLFQLPCAA